MAGEVNVIEYAEQIYTSDNFISGSAMPEPLRKQVLDIGVRSAAFGGDTAYVIVKSVATAMWVREGDSTVNAENRTAENEYVAADGTAEYPVTKDGTTLITHIDTVADA